MGRCDAGSARQHRLHACPSTVMRAQGLRQATTDDTGGEDLADTIRALDGYVPSSVQEVARRRRRWGT